MSHPHALASSVRFCALLVAGLALPAVASAQAVTIYRCTDASGNLTVQNQPCPAGTTQRAQQMQGVSSAPPSAPAATPAAAPAAAPPSTALPEPAAPAAQTTTTNSRGEFVTTSTGPEPRILDSATLPRTQEPAAPDPARPPPPPLFRCATYDGDSYLAEDADQPPRCLRLRTVGLDGNPSGGAGQACEVVRDQCARVPDGGACDAWRRFAREAESRWRFAHPDNAETRRAEYERLAKIVGESCGG